MNTLRSYVHTKIAQKNGQRVDFNTYIATFAVEIFPALWKNKEIIPEGFKLLADCLIAFVEENQYKNRYKSFKKDALQIAFEEEWLKNYSIEIKQTWFEINPKILSLDGNALQFNDKLFEVYCKSTQKTELLFKDKDYGKKKYIPEQKYLESIPIKVRKEKIIETQDCDAKLNIFWSSLFPLPIQPLIPFWKNKVSTSDYDKLKEYLTVCSKDNGENVVKNHALKLALYVAEWYKREYNGHENGNALQSIGLYCKAREIWNTGVIPEEYLYRTEKDDKTRENNHWLHSLYVLGGLALNYKTDRLDKIIDELYKCYRDEDSSFVPDKDKEYVNNRTINYSIKNEGGSLHSFLKIIIDDRKFPFAESDMSEEPFNTFITKVQEGIEKKLREKFWLEWLVYYHPNYEYMRRNLKIRIYPELDGAAHRYISYNRLVKWGIPTDLKDFQVEIAFFYGEDELYREKIARYSNVYNGYFVGWLSNDYVLCSNVPAEDFDNVKFFINNKEIQSFQIEPYKQLYKTEKPHEWSSKNNSQQKTAVLFRNYCVLEEEQPNPVFKQFVSKSGKKDGGDYRWVDIIASVTISSPEGGRNKTFYCQCGYVNILPKLYNNSVDYTDSCYVKRLTKDVGQNEYAETLIPVLFGREGFDVKFREKDEKPKDINENNYSLEYRKEGDRSFKGWNTGQYPEQGFIEIRVKYNKVANLKVYYIPFTQVKRTSYPFKRDLKNNTIHCEASVFKCPLTNEGYLYKDKREYEKDKDTIPFCLGTEEDFVVIPVYRAFNQKDILLNGKIIKTYNRNIGTVEIPEILHKNFIIRTIDKNGVRRENATIKMYEFSNPLNLDSTVSKKDIRFYLATKRNNDVDKKWSFDLGKGGVDEYKFYYWSLNESDSPIEISSSYDEEKGKLILDETYFKKEGVVFQSLKNVCPRHYCMPTYNVSPLTNQRTPSTSLLIKSFEIAVEHNIYFSVFKPLHHLLEADENLPRFFKDYWLHKNMQLDDIDYKALHRMADEFLFDWMFLKRRHWWSVYSKIENRENKQKFAEAGTKLFLSNPHCKKEEEKFLRDIVKEYWSKDRYKAYNDAAWNFRASSNNIANIAIRFMRTTNDNALSFCRGRDEDVCRNFIREFRESTNPYKQVSEFLEKQNILINNN